jgi:hypothetical protein
MNFDYATAISRLTIFTDEIIPLFGRIKIFVGIIIPGTTIFDDISPERDYNLDSFAKGISRMIAALEQASIEITSISETCKSPLLDCLKSDIVKAILLLQSANGIANEITINLKP